ncbi:testis-specific serine/threonine-protein kinase 6 [Ixodes scapularis]
MTFGRCVMKEGVTYACKIVSKELTSSIYQTKFLPRELKILGSTRHPHIARIYTIIEEPKKRVRRLDERTTHVYFMQLASALAYLHKNDIAHRDLKCENVLLTTLDVVKLTDFSFSRYCTSAATKKKELSATFCGSEAYAAPEILQGIRYLPKREDMWSLGVILYVMVTGDLPFESGNLPRQLRLQMTRVVRFPKVLPLSNELKNLIRCMLEPVIGLRASMGRVIRHPWIRRYPSPFKELSRKIYQEGSRRPGTPVAPVAVPPQDPAVPPPPRLSAGPGESSRGGGAARLSDSASRTASELESLGVRKDGSGAEDQRSGGSSGSQDGSRETSGLRELKRQQAVESLAIGDDAATSNQDRTRRPSDDFASGKQSIEGSTGSDASGAATDG